MADPCPTALKDPLSGHAPCRSSATPTSLLSHAHPSSATPIPPRPRPHPSSAMPLPPQPRPSLLSHAHPSSATPITPQPRPILDPLPRATSILNEE
ncbi:hypothetical protein NHX12_022183 [Muraenolepis orangiensis]|uniref:Uncharacterized protein n=1 Tax=Muraenolepis orangiensis TaxID=630683 RepID=A0A9Q0IT74_9TELE|nr:hypothetical protein NHX12_022183 [Muraenolepis orangiensis]